MKLDSFGYDSSPSRRLGRAWVKLLDSSMKQTILAGLAWLLGTTSALAQDVYRQTVVVTAAATPVELGTANRTLTVITRNQIDALPAFSVADVLRMTASVDVRARG